MYKTLSVVVSILLAGCASQSEIKPAFMPVIPSVWHNQSLQSTISIDDNWHTIFNNKNLDNLIIIAVQNNSQIARAGYRLQQASLSKSLQENNTFPIFSASLTGSNSKNLTNGSDTQRYGTSLNVEYVIDISNQLSKAIDAKQYEELATAQDLEAIKLGIEASVVNTYFAKALVNEKIFIANQNLEKAKSVNKLISIRNKAGASSKLDLLMSEKNIMNIQSSLQSLLKEKETLSNTMAFLLDVPPHSIAIDELTRFPTKSLKQPTSNIPAITLSNRPDVKASELRIKKALSDVDYASASFYPTFNLTSSFGTGGTALKDIVSNPIGSLALGVALPFLNWNANSINLSISKIQYEDIKTAHKQTIYNALAEVENALDANDRYKNESGILFRAYKNSQNQENLYNIRYKAGVSSLKELLDSSDVTRNARLAYMQSLYNWYTNRINLHLALGVK